MLRSTFRLWWKFPACWMTIMSHNEAHCRNPRFKKRSDVGLQVQHVYYFIRNLERQSWQCVKWHSRVSFPAKWQQLVHRGTKEWLCGEWMADGDSLRWVASRILSWNDEVFASVLFSLRCLFYWASGLNLPCQTGRSDGVGTMRATRVRVKVKKRDLDRALPQIVQPPRPQL